MIKRVFSAVYAAFTDERSNRAITLLITILVPVISGVWYLTTRAADTPAPAPDPAANAANLQPGDIFATTAIGAEIYQDGGPVRKTTAPQDWAFQRITLRRAPFHIALSNPEPLFAAMEVEPELKIMFFRAPSFLAKEVGYSVSPALAKDNITELFSPYLAGADSPIGGNWIAEAGENCWDATSGWNLNNYWTADGRFTEHAGRTYAKYVSQILYCDTNPLHGSAALPSGTWYLLLGVGRYTDRIEVTFEG